MHNFFILQFLFLVFSNSEGLSRIHIYCSNYTNYTSGSAFESNLDQLLKSLLENTLKNDWFSNNTVGESPNKVYGLAMCYYDRATNDSCRACLTQAAANFTQWCPYSIDAVVWYNECLVRYKYENFSFLETSAASVFSSSNNQNPFDPEHFYKVLDGLTERLIVDVATSPKLLAIGEANYTGSQNISGLVQCMRDLPAHECQNCLIAKVDLINTTTCGDGATACSMWGINCYMRYEAGYGPFYNPYLLTPPPSLPSPPPKGSKSFAVIIVVSVILVVIAVLAIVGIFFWARSCSKTPKNTGDDDVVILHENAEQSLKYILNPNAEYQVFDLITLRKATDDFSDMNKLGKGGFGPVYKGIVPDGKEIAVKILSEGSGQGTKEFKNEVDLLAKLRHKNLVQLLGCCIQKNQKMLCYEYLPNGSLDKILFAKVESAQLGWKARFKIIEGISRGLHYLHEESRLKIIHRDLKASNILLDKDMNPKISDFGLARFFEDDQTHKDTSVIAGTFGYMAPEYILHGNFSAKSDVYGFGILVLEIVTGRKNSSFYGSGRVSNLTDHALQHWNNKTISQLKDPMLENEYLDEIKRCVYIALLCVQGDPNDRLNMETVKNMLSSNSENTTDMPSYLSISKLVGFNFGNETEVKGDILI